MEQIHHPKNTCSNAKRHFSMSVWEWCDQIDDEREILSKKSSLWAHECAREFFMKQIKNCHRWNFHEAMSELRGRENSTPKYLICQLWKDFSIRRIMQGESKMRRPKICSLQRTFIMGAWQWKIYQKILALYPEEW
jgi:hypothetical protein